MQRPARLPRRSGIRLSTTSSSSTKRRSTFDGGSNGTPQAAEGSTPMVSAAEEALVAVVAPAASITGATAEKGSPPHTEHMTSGPAPRERAGRMESVAIRLDTRGVTASLLQGKLRRHEVDALRAEAHREYRFKKFRYDVIELHRLESIARDELADVAAAQWKALLSCEAEAAARKGIRGGCGGESKALAMLQRRLLERQRGEADALAAREADLREEGRLAWLAEVERKAQRKAESTALADWHSAQEVQFRRAVTFLVCRERADRESLNEELAAHAAELARVEREGRAEAERLAQERFDNSPEQIALREEAERKAAKARRVAAKAERKFNEEQRRFVGNCHHGRNGGSIFEGPAPRKVCGRCRVRFDDELGFYIHMDRPRPKAGPGIGGAPANMRASADTAVGVSAAMAKAAPTATKKKIMEGKGQERSFSSPIPAR